MLDELIFIIHLISLLKNQITGNSNIAVVHIFWFFSKEATGRRTSKAFSTSTTTGRARRTGFQFQRRAFMVG